MTAFDRLAEYYLPSPEHWWQHVEAYAENGIAHLPREPAFSLALSSLPGVTPKSSRSSRSRHWRRI